MPDNKRDILNYTVHLPKSEVSIETLWKLWAYGSFKDKQIPTMQYTEMRKAFKLGIFEASKYMNAIIQEGCSIKELAEVIYKFVDEGQAYLEDLR